MTESKVASNANGMFIGDKVSILAPEHSALNANSVSVWEVLSNGKLLLSVSEKEEGKIPFKFLVLNCDEVKLVEKMVESKIESSITRGGDVLFPESLEVANGMITWKKRNKNIISSTETSISLKQIASINHKNKLIGSDLTITSTGGDKIEAKGFKTDDIKKILTEVRGINEDATNEHQEYSVEEFLSMVKKGTMTDDILKGICKSIDKSSFLKKDMNDLKQNLTRFYLNYTSLEPMEELEHQIEMITSMITQNELNEGISKIYEAEMTLEEIKKLKIDAQKRIEETKKKFKEANETLKKERELYSETILDQSLISKDELEAEIKGLDDQLKDNVKEFETERDDKLKGASSEEEKAAIKNDFLDKKKKADLDTRSGKADLTKASKEKERQASAVAKKELEKRDQLLKNSMDAEKVELKEIEETYKLELTSYQQTKLFKDKLAELEKNWEEKKKTIDDPEKLAAAEAVYNSSKKNIEEQIKHVEEEKTKNAKLLGIKYNAFKDKISKNKDKIEKTFAGALRSIKKVDTLIGDIASGEAFFQ